MSFRTVILSSHARLDVRLVGFGVHAFVFKSDHSVTSLQTLLESRGSLGAAEFMYIIYCSQLNLRVELEKDDMNDGHSLLRVVSALLLGSVIECKARVCPA